jgi:Uncharacterised nucleotidyltransferase
VVRALQRSGIESIVLKGPTIAEWLYPNEARPYIDADLLVAPGQVMEAAAVMQGLGFAPFERHVSPHAHPWLRAADGAQIDLHVTIWGPHLPPAELWLELRDWVQVARVGAARVEVLNVPARALHVVLHAAQHRHNSEKAREDLRRALERTPLDAWRQAERLADRLWALGEVADGLLLEPEGQALLAQLPLVQAALRVNHEGAPRRTIAWARLRQASGLSAKLQIVRRWLRHSGLGCRRRAD